MHIFPQLRKLERKYGDHLAVIGVHSPKFTQERETSSLRRAIQRYEIEHPVVNDKDFDVWTQYGARAWPTLMFIDPLGNILGKHEGEFTAEQMQPFIGELIAEYENAGVLTETILPTLLERDKARDGLLSFPGKILTDPANDRLVIADSNHHRIIVASSGGEIQAEIGSGDQGLRDGNYSASQFNDPQGMVLCDEILYVADTKNHAIRTVDLREGLVATLAGTGHKSLRFHQGGSGLKTQLNSPWDVTIHDETLYIAMAGFHQLWKLDLKTGNVNPHAGSGREHIQDGLLSESMLAQPSGITTNGDKLFFADSETSSIRMADIEDSGQVTTLIGLDLFTFGDADGIGTEARLQHPLGICLGEEELFVADSYNNKIKRLTLKDQRVVSLFGKNEPGYKDGTADSAQFDEPGGVSILSNKLYIADTNNHVIRVADLDTSEVFTMDIG